MSETSSEDGENESFEQRHESMIIKIKPGKKHIFPPNSDVHVNGALLISKDKDKTKSLWVQVGDDHYLLCSLGEMGDHQFRVRFNEPVPVILYVKGEGTGYVNVFGAEKSKF